MDGVRNTNFFTVLTSFDYTDYTEYNLVSCFHGRFDLEVYSKRFPRFLRGDRIEVTFDRYGNLLDMKKKLDPPLGVLLPYNDERGITQLF